VAKTSVLQVRIDTELKREAEELFAEIGLDTPSAVRLFFKQSVARRAIPFPLDSAAVKTDSEYQKFTREELHDRQERKLNTELKKTNPCDDPDSYLNNPLHAGDTFRIFPREELHER
jgi:addiction module RelB/DinJ family antitoxin